MSKKNVLEVANLCKSFNGKRVVDDLTFKVEAGDIYGFLGPNGAGKTTTIRIMLGLVHRDSGSVKINGYDTIADFDKAIKEVGAIVENPSFYEYLSAYDNLVQMANLHSKIGVERVREVLEIVGLTGRAKDKVKTFSLGMKQRLGIARALLNKPSVVFLDEPTNGLDPQGVLDIRKLITDLARDQGITFLITTHTLYEVEQICNKVAILKQGKLIAQDYVESLLNTEKETLEVHTHTTNQEKAILILEQASYISKIEPRSFGLNVELDKGSSAKLNEELIRNNIPVQYLVPKHQSLEEFFIELTGDNSPGGGPNDHA